MAVLSAWRCPVCGRVYRDEELYEATCPVCGSADVSEVSPGRYKCATCGAAFEDSGAVEYGEEAPEEAVPHIEIAERKANREAEVRDAEKDVVAFISRHGLLYTTICRHLVAVVRGYTKPCADGVKLFDCGLELERRPDGAVVARYGGAEVVVRSEAELRRLAPKCASELRAYAKAVRAVVKKRGVLLSKLAECLEARGIDPGPDPCATYAMLLDRINCRVDPEAVCGRLYLAKRYTAIFLATADGLLYEITKALAGTEPREAAPSRQTAAKTPRYVCKTCGALLVRIYYFPHDKGDFESKRLEGATRSR